MTWKQVQYRLTGRLESGALAELFEAVRNDDTRVVVKLLHARTTDPRYARAIADTQQKLAAVEGEGIIRVLDLGLVRGRLGIAREHVEGYSLGQVLQRLNTREVILPAPLALYVVLQLAESVDRAHEAGVMHGAMTPGNVLIGRDGRVGIVDFGALEALQSVAELKAFAGKGRSAYRAPEVSQGANPTAVSDVYSVGALAYELLTLREPMTAERNVSTRHAPLPPPSRLDRRINPRLDPILLRALEQSPGRRFRSCAEFSSALRNFLAASGGMPSRADLGRVMGDLFPNEVQFQAHSQVPFTESFAFGAIDGVAIVRAEPVPEVSRVLTARPSFSLGAIPAALDEAVETIEAMPALAAMGPVEDWEAPPGEAPQGRRLALGLSTPVPSSISLSVLSRVRVAEDFEATSGVSEEEEKTDPGQAPRAPRRVRPEIEPLPPEPPTDQGPSVSVSAGRPRAPLVTEPDGRKRRMVTEERRIWRWSLRRRRYLAIAVIFAAVGAVSFGLYVWRFGKPAGKQPLSQASGRVERPPEPEKAVRPEPVRVEPARAEPARVEPGPAPRESTEPTEPRAEPYRPPSGRGAWLYVEANVRSRVFVDGKLAGSTPLRRLKVAAGKRTLAIESIETGERREFARYFRKGKTVKLEERFAAAPRR